MQSGAGPLWLSQPGLVPGRDLRVRIMARDVMLSLQAPEGISALNIIPARVESLTQTGRDILVRLEAGPETILSQITRRSAQLLDLRPGMPVHAVLKTLSVAPGSVAQSLSSAAQTPEARE